MFSNQSTSGNNFNAHILRVLWRQQQELLKKAPDGVHPFINNEDLLDIQADIEGPRGTPYENGLFRLKFFIPNEFPQVAPKGFFLTKIYHPNVSEKGEICVNTLKKDWDPKKWSLYNLLEVIKCLLIVPFPESSLNEEAGKIFMENYHEYCTIAKIFTSVHAMKHDDAKMIVDAPQYEQPMERSIGRSRTLNCEVKRDAMGMGDTQRGGFELGVIEEKPSMTRLPFMRTNSLQVGNKSDFGFHSIHSIDASEIIQQKRSNKEEIKKWLMRI